MLILISETWRRHAKAYKSLSGSTLTRWKYGLTWDWRSRNPAISPEPIQAYSEGMKVKPTDVGYLLLAHALEQSGRQDEAATATQRAKVLSANFAEAQRIGRATLGQ